MSLIWTGEDGSEKKWVLENSAGKTISGEFIKKAYRTKDHRGKPAMGFEFGSTGASLFGQLTGDNQGATLAIVVDGVAQTVATIQSRITTQGQLTGTFTDAEVQDLASIVQLGRLPVRLEHVSEVHR